MSDSYHQTKNKSSANLGVSSGFQELGEAERLGLSIATICINASDYPGHFTLAQETPALVRIIVRERNEENVSTNCNQYGQDAFNDELSFISEQSRIETRKLTIQLHPI
jgi:hypothetical protein